MDEPGTHDRSLTAGGGASPRWRGGPADPPEPWEQPIPAGMRRTAAAWPGLAPYRPRRARDVPSGALAALAGSCGADQLERLLLLPASARVADLGGGWVATPTQVLGVGRQAVGLWVAAPPEPAVRVRIPLADLVAIDDTRVLAPFSCSRLSLLAREQRLSVRYDPAAHWQPAEVVQELRRTLSGPPQPVPPLPPPQELDLPYRWQTVAAARGIDLGGRRSAIVFGARRVPGRRDPTEALVALTPWELLVAKDAERGGWLKEPYDVDTLYVPRGRLERLGARDRLLEIHAGGAELVVELWPELAATVCQRLAGSVTGLPGKAPP